MPKNLGCSQNAVSAEKLKEYDSVVSKNSEKLHSPVKTQRVDPLVFHLPLRA